MQVGDEIVLHIIHSIEHQTQKKIFHVSVMDRPVGDTLDCHVIFTDGEKLDTQISVMSVEGKLAFRIRGNYF